jgi:hypothetical protein
VEPVLQATLKNNKTKTIENKNNRKNNRKNGKKYDPNGNSTRFVLFLQGHLFVG